jgi:hypothetical protein
MTHGRLEACLLESVGTNLPEPKDERLVFSNSTNWRFLWQDCL